MYIIPLKGITLLSSNVAESEYLEWAESTTYNTDDTVYVFEDADGNGITPHLIYSSLIDSNTGVHPLSDVEKWTKVSATNSWKMFDKYVNTQTKNTNKIEVEINCSKCDSLILFMLDAVEITVVTKHNSTIISTQTISLVEQNSTSWSTFFFDDRRYRQDIFIDIPLFVANATLTITISHNSGYSAKCGHCCVGRKIYIGQTLYGVNPNINDYSKKETDDFGDTYLKQGHYSKKIDLPVQIKSSEIDYILKIFAENRGVPAVWQNNNKTTDFESLLVYGFFSSFDIVLETFSLSECSVEIEGLI